MVLLAYEQTANPWLSWSYVRDNADTLRAALVEHVALTLESVAIAALVAVPLAVLAYWVRPLAYPILASAGVLYTIPSLGLFAILGPVLGPTTTMVVTALVLYALLVIVRTTLTGLLQVPDEVRQAATGMGYGRWSRLWRVELPLALPGLLTGLRLATVSTVSLVTVGALVGKGALGGLIVAGFRNNFYRAQILTATLMCIALALILDQALAAVGRLLTPWTRRPGS